MDAAGRADLPASARPWSRRGVLAAGLLLPVAACTRSERPAPVPPPVDPDVALRSAAAAREQDLLARYDRALAAGAPRPAPAVLAGLRAEHAAHLAALLGPPEPASTTTTPTTTAPTTVASTTPPPGPAGLADLRAAEAAAAQAHAAAVPGSSRRLAAVLASLSAAEASHAVALA